MILTKHLEAKIRQFFVIFNISLRWDKLNSQYIVTKFSILHVGERSLFRFQTSRETRMAMLELEITRAPPLIRVLEWVRPKDCIFTVLDLKSENFGKF